MVDDCPIYNEFREKGISIQRCWAHLRRAYYDLYKALPSDRKASSASGNVVKKIDAIFDLERNYRLDELTAAQIKEKRNSAEYKGLLGNLFSYIDSLNPGKGSPMDKAKVYFRHVRPDLLTYLEDGRVDMTNNFAERIVKPLVINRKNFLFSKIERGAESSAILMTAVRTALANGVVPKRKIEWALTNISKLTRKNSCYGLRTCHRKSRLQTVWHLERLCEIAYR